MRILELNNPDNFSLAYTISIPPTCMTIDGEEICARITEVLIPVIFNSQIVSVSVSTSVPAGSIWSFAGLVTKVVQTAIGESISEEKKPVFLNRRNIICFEEIKADYTLTFLPPKWFKDVTLGIYQYDGSDNFASDLLVSQELLVINSKLDQILNQP